MIQISNNVIAALRKQATEESPLEACGYLAGNDSIFLKYYPMTNVDASKSHFSFDPEEQFLVVRKARKDGFKLLAVYHSHPETPARPSQEDIKLAYDPLVSYVILSLLTDEICSFKIINGNVERENIEVI